MTSPSPAAGVPTAVVRGVGHPEGDQGVPEVDPAGEAQLHDGAGQDQPGGRGGRRPPAAPRQRDPHRLSTGQNTDTRTHLKHTRIDRRPHVKEGAGGCEKYGRGNMLTLLYTQ